MAIKEEYGNDGLNENIRESLMQGEKNLADEEGGSDAEKSKGKLCMVYFSTFVAVCGSYAFGSCVSRVFLLLRRLYFNCHKGHAIYKPTTETKHLFYCSCITSKCLVLELCCVTD